MTFLARKCFKCLGKELGLRILIAPLFSTLANEFFACGQLIREPCCMFGDGPALPPSSGTGGRVKPTLLWHLNTETSSSCVQ